MLLSNHTVMRIVEKMKTELRRVYTYSPCFSSVAPKYNITPESLEAAFSDLLSAFEYDSMEIDDDD